MRVADSAQIRWARGVSGAHLPTKKQVSDYRRGSNEITLRCARSATAAAFDLAVQKGLTGGSSAGPATTRPSDASATVEGPPNLDVKTWPRAKENLEEC